MSVVLSVYDLVNLLMLLKLFSFSCRLGCLKRTKDIFTIAFSLSTKSVLLFHFTGAVVYKSVKGTQNDTPSRKVRKVEPFRKSTDFGFVMVIHEKNLILF